MPTATFDELHPGNVPPPPAAFNAGGYTIAQWFFGVQTSDIVFFDPMWGWVYAVRVEYVYPGTPAYYVVEAGDIITRVNGLRVTNYNEFHWAVAYSTGVISLRARDVHTGYYVDFPSIHLLPATPPSPGPVIPPGPTPVPPPSGPVPGTGPTASSPPGTGPTGGP